MGPDSSAVISPISCWDRPGPRASPSTTTTRRGGRGTTPRTTPTRASGPFAARSHTHGAYAQRVHNHDGRYLRANETASDSNRVDGFHANQLSRVASATTNRHAYPDDGDLVEIMVQPQINAGGVSGYLIIDGVTYGGSRTDVFDSSLGCGAIVDGELVEGSGRGAFGRYDDAQQGVRHEDA